jgi:hypothetical protein
VDEACHSKNKAKACCDTSTRGAAIQLGKKNCCQLRISSVGISSSPFTLQLHDSTQKCLLNSNLVSDCNTTLQRNRTGNCNMDPEMVEATAATAAVTVTSTASTTLY